MRMDNYYLNLIIKMVKELTDKIKLFRVLHGVDKVYISSDGELFVEEPNNFSGQCLSWYENGQLEYEHNYKNGKPHGKWLGWNENGQLKYEHNYKNGKEQGKCWYWYKNGKEQGKCLYWYENGQLEYE